MSFRFLARCGWLVPAGTGRLFRSAVHVALSLVQTGALFFNAIMFADFDGFFPRGKIFKKGVGKP